ncbi:MAG: hypothetical protein ACE5G3_12535, partial [Gammaproteobacteria bacterium]
MIALSNPLIRTLRYGIVFIETPCCMGRHRLSNHCCSELARPFLGCPLSVIRDAAASGSRVIATASRLYSSEYFHLAV